MQTWSYGLVPGREIRVTKGDVIEARRVNQLPTPITIYWHGVAIRDDVDGVPGLTPAPVRPGGEFTYRPTASQPRTRPCLDPWT